MNALFAAIPGIGNVLLVSLLFWLIFSILGVQLFAGLFHKCVDGEGNVLAANIVPNKNACLNHSEEYRWVNSNVNFDNVMNGFLSLFQVVSLRRLSGFLFIFIFIIFIIVIATPTLVHCILVIRYTFRCACQDCRANRAGIAWMRCRSFLPQMQATFEGWMELMVDAVDATTVRTQIFTDIFPELCTWNRAPKGPLTFFTNVPIPDDETPTKTGHLQHF